MNAAALARRARVRSSRASAGAASAAGSGAGGGLLQGGHRGGERGPGGGADGGVLVAQELGGLERSRAGVRRRGAARTCRARRTARPPRPPRAPVDQGRGQVRREEGAPGPGPDGAGGVWARGTPNRDRAASGDRQTSRTAREPMCFSSHRTEATPSRWYASKAWSGCSSRSSRVRGGDGAHRRRQVQQPARVDGEPAHDLQRGGRVVLAHRDAGHVRGLDHARALRRRGCPGRRARGGAPVASGEPVRGEAPGTAWPARGTPRRRGRRPMFVRDNEEP